MSLSPGFSFTNCRIRSAPGDTAPRLCVRTVPVRRGFLSAAALRSSGSAGTRAPLFAAFIATTPASDCCAPFGFGCRQMSSRPRSCHSQPGPLAVTRTGLRRGGRTPSLIEAAWAGSPRLPAGSASALQIALSMLDCSAHIPRYRRFTAHLTMTRARLAERRGVTCSFAAEDLHLLPTHQFAWRSQMELSFPTGPPGSYPDRTFTGRRRRACLRTDQIILHRPSTSGRTPSLIEAAWAGSPRLPTPSAGRLSNTLDSHKRWSREGGPVSLAGLEGQPQLQQLLALVSSLLDVRAPFHEVVERLRVIE